MNYKIPILLFTAFSFCLNVKSQTLSNKVVASGGSYSTAAWGSLSATVGEVAITSLPSANVTLLQGFQQPTSGLAGIKKTSNIVAASVYPNPAVNEVTLEVTLPAAATITYKIFDVNGKEITNGNFIVDATLTATQSLDISGFSNGMYLIMVYKNQEMLENIKVQIIH